MGAGRLYVELSRSIDVAAWEREHAHGLVGDRFPYGLDRLQTHGWEVIPRPARNRATRLPELGNRATRLFELGNRATRILGRPLGDIELSMGRFDAQQRRSCDAVLCWDERSGVPAAQRRRSRRRGEPPVVTGAIWLIDASLNGAARQLLRHGLANAAGVFVSSEAQVQPLIKQWGIAPNRVRYVPFGVDVSSWTPNTEVEPEPGLVLSIGSDRHRHYELLVEAMTDVHAHLPDARLLLLTRLPVAVPGEFGERMFAATLPVVRAHYGRASVVAVALRPNLHCSGLTVVLEAMACGRPVVATRTPGMEQYIDHERTGLLVPAGDRAALAKAVESLLRDPQRAAAMGAQGRREVVEHFSTVTQAAALDAFLRDCL